MLGRWGEGTHDRSPGTEKIWRGKWQGGSHRQRVMGRGGEGTTVALELVGVWAPMVRELEIQSPQNMNLI